MPLDLVGNEVGIQGRAMATEINIRARVTDVNSSSKIELDAALDIFAKVERACTRFDPSSPLMQANARPMGWQYVGKLCFDALKEARSAYTLTSGRFDPRILQDLIGLGYDKSLGFANGDVRVEGSPSKPRQSLQVWRPRFRGASCEVMLNGVPVDLGGIGKGLAVRWASQHLSKYFENFLVEAGGDCYCAGLAPGDEYWRIAVENPAGGSSPVAVLSVSNNACTTSSIRLRHWTHGTEQVHHIIDPRTGQPGGGNLASVTVVGDDPAISEVWSKVLFLYGHNKIAEVAHKRGIAALWICKSGEMAFSPHMAQFVIWQA